jgi:hypothetical protein
MLPSLRQVLSITFLCAVALIPVTAADVRIEPTFGHPYVFADRIVFASVDGKRLIGIDKQGHLHWEVAFPVRVFLQRSDDQLLVQSGADVYRLNVSNGTKSQVFRMPKDEILFAEIGTNFLAASDNRHHNHVRIISPVDHSTAWKSSSIEEIVQVTPSTVVAVTADRKYERKQSYHLENENLRGFDRKDGQPRWSMPLGSDSGSVASAQVGVFLAVVDRLRTYDPVVGDARLLVLNPDTGAVFLKRDGKFTDLWPGEGSLGVLEVDSGGADKAEFYVCKVPECAKENPISLSAKEILTVRLYREYIITAGIYDSACFDRATGTRLWEKGQLEWSQPFDDEMVVTNFSPSDQTARIIAVELRSGHEQVLFSRKVTRHDKANFRPW